MNVKQIKTLARVAEKLTGAEVVIIHPSGHSEEVPLANYRERIYCAIGKNPTSKAW